MLEEIFSVSEETVSLSYLMTGLVSALILGLFLSLVFILTHKKDGYSPSFAVTIVVLPAIIAIIIMMVGGNVARAFSLAGAFSLIRFRNTPEDTKDLAYIFLTMAIGLTCGLGLVLYAIIFTVVISLVWIVLSAVNFASPRHTALQLKITVPEDLNYQGLFDDIFAKYCRRSQLKRVKTRDFGALFEMIYIVEINDNVDQKEFIDELRTRNGNLNIALTINESDYRTYGWRESA